MNGSRNRTGYNNFSFLFNHFLTVGNQIILVSNKDLLGLTILYPVQFQSLAL